MSITKIAVILRRSATTNCGIRLKLKCNNKLQYIAKVNEIPLRGAIVN